MTELSRLMNEIPMRLRTAIAPICPRGGNQTLRIVVDSAQPVDADGDGFTNDVAGTAQVILTREGEDETTYSLGRLGYVLKDNDSYALLGLGPNLRFEPSTLFTPMGRVFDYESRGVTYTRDANEEDLKSRVLRIRANDPIRVSVGNYSPAAGNEILLVRGVSQALGMLNFSSLWFTPFPISSQR